MAKSIQTVFSLLMLTLMLSCIVKNKQTSEGGIRIEKAQESDYVTGAGGYRGKIFSVQVVSDKQEVKFDSLWVNNKRIKLSQQKKDAKTFVVEASYVDALEERTMTNESQKEEQYSFPIKYEGKAVISYLYQGTKKYLLISSFTKTQQQGEEVK